MSRTTAFYWTVAQAAVILLMISGCSSPVPARLVEAAVEEEKVIIAAPATPSSIPVILAARSMSTDTAGGAPIDVSIYADQSQANTLFLRGDVTILVTGLSVGVQFYKNGAPVQMINSYVSGLTYLLTYGKKVSSFRDLKGQEVYVPFEGSPIEETTRFLAEKEGLVWNRDIKPVYSPFPSSVELLKLGKAEAVALPEPYVSLIEKQAEVFISFSYKEKWDAATGDAGGYPQVATFVKKDWAAAHPALIARLNAELKNAILSTGQDPAAAVEQAKAKFNFPSNILRNALERTAFSFTETGEMKQEIQRYYQQIGKPLDETTFNAFFYHH